MTLRAVLALAWSLIIGLAGGWLILSPWAVGQQPSSGDWTAVTNAQVRTGVGLLVLAIIGLVLAIITKRADLLLLSRNGFSSRRARLRLHDLELCAAARPVLYCWNHSLIIYVGDLRAPDSCRPLEWSVMRVNFL